MAEDPIRVQVNLADGTSVEAEVEIDLAAIRGATGPMVVPSGLTARDEIGRRVSTAIATRLELGTGQLVLNDTKGRFWIIPARSIVAAHVSGWETTSRPFGFAFADGPSPD